MLTLGAEDHTACEANYAYTPIVGDHFWHLRMASISLHMPTKNETWSMPADVLLLSSAVFDTMSVTHSVFAFFINATDAKFSWLEGQYMVNCAEVTRFPNFTLNMGEYGSTPVLLHPSNYIVFDEFDVGVHFRRFSQKKSDAIGS